MSTHRIQITLQDFGHEHARQEAARQGVAVEELVVHALMYYLGDLDSGRVAARILRGADADPEFDDDEDGDEGRRFGRGSED